MHCEEVFEAQDQRTQQLALSIMTESQNMHQWHEAIRVILQGARPTNEYATVALSPLGSFSPLQGFPFSTGTAIFIRRPAGRKPLRAEGHAICSMYIQHPKSTSLAS